MTQVFRSATGCPADYPCIWIHDNSEGSHEHMGRDNNQRREAIGRAKVFQTCPPLSLCSFMLISTHVDDRRRK